MKKFLMVVSMVVLSGCAGAAGYNGTDGKNGLDGAQGEQGIQGEAGQDGEDGTDGQNGTNGAGCTVTQEKYGAAIVCGNTKAVILHGRGWQNCQVEERCHVKKNRKHCHKVRRCDWAE